MSGWWPPSCRISPAPLPDGETFVALRQLDEGVENPLEDLPEYKEMLEIADGFRAAPPVVLDPSFRRGRSVRATRFNLHLGDDKCGRSPARTGCSESCS
jgi:hypothetical protein